MRNWLRRWFDKEIAYAVDRIAAVDADTGWEQSSYWVGVNAELRIRFTLRKQKLLFWRTLLGV